MLQRVFISSHLTRILHKFWKNIPKRNRNAQPIFTENSFQLHFSGEHGRQLNKYVRVNKHGLRKFN